MIEVDADLISTQPGEDAPGNLGENDLTCVSTLLDKPPKVHPYKPSSWGPRAADELVADYGGWHGAWVTS
jgi:hypothetical protein